MKITSILCLLAIALLTGCASKTANDFNHVEGNFGYATHVSGFTDRSMTMSFCYRDTNGNTTVVWPYLQMVAGNNMVVSNDTALLVGGVASLFTDGNERLKMRLIAFKGPVGPPMDITDQVLKNIMLEPIWVSPIGAAIIHWIKLMVQYGYHLLAQR